MTTIAYRDGIMVSDSRAFAGNSSFIGSKEKIFQLPDGGLIGISTNKPGLGESFAAWMHKRMLSGTSLTEPAQDAPGRGEHELTALMVLSDGTVLYFHDSSEPAGPLSAPYFAIGSGDRYAMGAMAMGASAEEAIQVAARYDPWTAAPLNVWKIQGLVPSKH